MQVVFTLLAERQIDRLHEYLTEVAGEARADAVVNRLTSYCLGLELFPRRGIRRDDIIPGLRIIGFERRFAIAFVVTEGLVLIEASSTAGRISRRPIESVTRNRSPVAATESATLTFHLS